MTFSWKQKTREGDIGPPVAATVLTVELAAKVRGVRASIEKDMGIITGHIVKWLLNSTQTYDSAKRICSFFILVFYLVYKFFFIMIFFLFSILI